MRKFKNFIPLDYEDKEKVKSEFRVKKIIKLLLLINLLLIPVAVSNIKTQVFNKEEKNLTVNVKGELIPIDKIRIVMDKASELNSEIKINNYNFIIKTSKLDNNDKMFQELYKNKKIKIESVNHGEDFDEIKGVLNE
ncbi:MULTISPECIES: hypothetical protein [Clostridium]|uniref:Uncharacterized protein n=1 Tax=Clostridium intestinale DSM 6191 TaxID=1121320 RepID=A0A1M5YZZ1_9CLOT|nr:MULTISPECIES: hypothetical protein [Clostridium]SHI17494.1 hypothetical protein SAMN02745941_02391 [Clostridium intestinale DSM 6191]